MVGMVGRTGEIPERNTARCPLRVGDGKGDVVIMVIVDVKPLVVLWSTMHVRKYAAGVGCGNGFLSGSSSNR